MTIKNNFDATGSVLSGIILGTIGVLSFIVQPGLVQGFVSELGLSEAAANQLAFDEMLGVAIATFVASFCKRFFNWRVILVVALLLSATGNVLSSYFLANPDLLSISRLVAGLGEGAIISLSFTIIGMTQRTERNLAAYLVLLLTYGALGLWLMPVALSSIGLAGVFKVWAVLTLASLALARFIPGSPQREHHHHEAIPDAPLSLCVVALIGVLLFNLAIGVAWANLFLIGMEISPNEQRIADALLIAQFIAILGALIPVFFEKQLGLFKPILTTIVGSAIAISLLLDSPGYFTFVVAVSGFNFLWNYGLPFILSGVGALDSKGKMISLAIALQMTGLGFGPFLAAIVLGDSGSFYQVELLIIALFLTSAVPLIYALRKRLLQKHQLQSAVI